MTAREEVKVGEQYRSTLGTTYTCVFAEPDDEGLTLWKYVEDGSIGYSLADVEYEKTWKNWAKIMPSPVFEEAWYAFAPGRCVSVFFSLKKAVIRLKDYEDGYIVHAMTDGTAEILLRNGEKVQP